MPLSNGEYEEENHKVQLPRDNVFLLVKLKAQRAPFVFATMSQYVSERPFQAFPIDRYLRGVHLLFWNLDN